MHKLDGKKRRFYYPSTSSPLRTEADWLQAQRELANQQRVHVFDPDNDEEPWGDVDELVAEQDEPGPTYTEIGPSHAKRPHVDGVFGPTVAAVLDPELFLRIVHDDSMHFVWLHVIPELVTLWTSKLYETQDWSLLKLGKVDEVVRLLNTIKPPQGRQEKVSDLDAKSWKAATSRFFALYLACPVLHQVLPQQYFTHFAKLIRVLRYLCGPEVEENAPAGSNLLDLAQCETLLKAWVADFSALYGYHHVSLSIHMLLHLVDTVRNVGPLWASNCFAFESANHWLVRTIHAKRQGQDQALLDVFTRFVIGQEYIDAYVDVRKTELCDALYDSGHAPAGYQRAKVYVWF
jgi:hypothetical protein